MAQHVVEMLIGRLITDEEFRCRFLESPEHTLRWLDERGLALSGTQMEALLGTDPGLWTRTAESIDPRLQKARFSTR